MSARNMLIMAPAQAAQVLVGLGTVVVFTRLISPDEYGVYALVLSASMMAHTAAVTWAEAAAFRFLPQAEREGAQPAHFATLLMIALIASVISAAILALCLVGMAWHGWTAAAVGFSAALSPIRFLTKIARETDRAEQRMARYAWRETLFLVSGFAAGVGLLTWTPMGPAAPFVGAVLAGLICLALDLPSLWKRRAGAPAQMSRAMTYASYGLPLAIGLAIELAMQTTTRAALAAYEGPAAAGAFAAAVGAVGRALDILFVWTALAFAPPLLRAFESGAPGAIATASAALGRALIAIAAPATVGLCLVAQPLCGLLVGEGLAADAALIAPYVAVMGLANGLSVYFATEAFVLSRRTGLRTAILIPVALAHVALAVVLTDMHGLIGAGAAAVISAVAGLILLSYFGMKATALSLPLRDIAKTALGCVAMAGAVAMIPAFGGWVEIFVKAGVGVGVYGACVVALDLGGLRGWLNARLARAPA